MKLTAKKVAKLRTVAGRHSDGQNLYLEVKPSRTPQWVYKYEIAGLSRYIYFGSINVLTLSEARNRARVFAQQRADGLDPREERLKAKVARAAQVANAKTFQQVAEDFFRSHSSRWKNPKHVAQFLSTMRDYVYPVIGKKAVTLIDVQDVLRVLEQKLGKTTFWLARHETASRTRARIEKVLGFATVRGLRSGDNPARWQGFLSTQLTRNRRHRPQPALPHAEIPAFMADLRGRAGIAARALEFCILNAARSGAVAGARLSEIDLKDAMWTVPPTRAGTKIKGDQPRRVPLADRAIEILRALPTEEGNPFVFLGLKSGTGITAAAMSKVIKTMNADRKRAGLPRYVDPKLENADVVVHGFRSTFKDWSAECTSHAGFVSEAALWHVVADRVEGAYRRGELLDKRRLLMNDWARYCGSAAKAQRRSAA
jgi:integrase